MNRPDYYTPSAHLLNQLVGTPEQTRNLESELTQHVVTDQQEGLDGYWSLERHACKAILDAMNPIMVVPLDWEQPSDRTTLKRSLHKQSESPSSQADMVPFDVLVNAMRGVGITVDGLRSLEQFYAECTRGAAQKRDHVAHNVAHVVTYFCGVASLDTARANLAIAALREGSSPRNKKPPVYTGAREWGPFIYERRRGSLRIDGRYGQIRASGPVKCSGRGVKIAGKGAERELGLRRLLTVLGSVSTSTLLPKAIRMDD